MRLRNVFSPQKQTRIAQQALKNFTVVWHDVFVVPGTYLLYLYLQKMYIVILLTHLSFSTCCICHGIDYEKFSSGYTSKLARFAKLNWTQLQKKLHLSWKTGTLKHPTVICIGWSCRDFLQGTFQSIERNDWDRGIIKSQKLCYDSHANKGEHIHIAPPDCFVSWCRRKHCSTIWYHSTCRTLRLRREENVSSNQLHPSLLPCFTSSLTYLRIYLSHLVTYLSHLLNQCWSMDATCWRNERSKKLSWA